MRAVVVSFAMVVRQILKDGMLLAVCFASILAGVFFRFAIPYLETLLCSFFAVSFILSPYYRLFDLLLMILTPYMICFASAMVMLDEHEQHLTRYLSVTPLQTRGYLVSRLVIPAVVAAFISLGVLALFQLTTWTIAQRSAMSVLCSLTGIISSLIIFSLSRNKIEGMAMGKLSSLILLGLPIPFLFHDNFQYIFSFLPSYWMSRFALDGSPMFFILSLVLSLATIPYFYARVLRKIL